MPAIQTEVTELNSNISVATAGIYENCSANTITELIIQYGNVKRN
jgi:hypothetical protein